MKRVSWGGIAIQLVILGILLVDDFSKPVALLVWLASSLAIYFIFSHD